MDTKRVSDPPYFKKLAQLYHYKFKHQPFDAIIASDDHALSFLLEYGPGIFAKTPVVFCGLNNYDEAILTNNSHITGVVEAFDIPSTLSAACQLQPNARNIVFVNDLTKTGQANRQVINKSVAALPKKFKIHFLESITMPDLLVELNQLSRDTIVVLMSFTRDRAGQVFTYDECIGMIADSITC
jgi:hypothetical protein